MASDRSISPPARGRCRPRIHALLSWYDESPLWLNATVASLLPHVDHIVAVDGAYHLFPDGEPQSRADQAHALVETCQAAKVALTLHRPRTVWYGNEVEKRNRLFALAELDSEPMTDWWWVIDADELVTNAPADLKDQLAATSLDVAQVMLWTRGDPYGDRVLPFNQQHALAADFYCPMRMLFRAIPGLRCDTAHYRYRTPDGRFLWGYPTVDVMEEPLDLLDLVRVEHRTTYRPLQRRRDSETYYERRDAAKIEQREVPA